MDNMNEKLILDRILKLEKDVETLFKDRNTTNDRLTRIETKLEFLSDGMEDLKNSIKELQISVQNLKTEPVKRWDSVVTAMITAIVAGVIAFFIGKMTGKVG